MASHISQQQPSWSERAKGITHDTKQHQNTRETSQSDSILSTDAQQDLGPNTSSQNANNGNNFTSPLPAEDFPPLGSSIAETKKENEKKEEVSESKREDEEAHLKGKSWADMFDDDSDELDEETIAALKLDVLKVEARPTPEKEDVKTSKYAGGNHGTESSRWANAPDEPPRRRNNNYSNTANTYGRSTYNNYNNNSNYSNNYNNNNNNSNFSSYKNRSSPRPNTAFRRSDEEADKIYNQMKYEIYGTPPPPETNSPETTQANYSPRPTEQSTNRYNNNNNFGSSQQNRWTHDKFEDFSDSKNERWNNDRRNYSPSANSSPTRSANRWTNDHYTSSEPASPPSNRGWADQRYHSSEKRTYNNDKQSKDDYNSSRSTTYHNNNNTSRWANDGFNDSVQTDSYKHNSEQSSPTENNRWNNSSRGNRNGNNSYSNRSNNNNYDRRNNQRGLDDDDEKTFSQLKKEIYGISDDNNDSNNTDDDRGSGRWNKDKYDNSSSYNRNNHSSSRTRVNWIRDENGQWVDADSPTPRRPNRNPFNASENASPDNNNSLTKNTNDRNNNEYGSSANSKWASDNTSSANSKWASHNASSANSKWANDNASSANSKWASYSESFDSNRRSTNKEEYSNLNNNDRHNNDSEPSVSDSNNSWANISNTNGFSTPDINNNSSIHHSNPANDVSQSSSVSLDENKKSNNTAPLESTVDSKNNENKWGKAPEYPTEPNNAGWQAFSRSNNDDNRMKASEEAIATTSKTLDNDQWAQASTLSTTRDATKQSTDISEPKPNTSFGSTNAGWDTPSYNNDEWDKRSGNISNIPNNNEWGNSTEFTDENRTKNNNTSKWDSYSENAKSKDSKQLSSLRSDDISRPANNDQYSSWDNSALSKNNGVYSPAPTNGKWLHDKFEDSPTETNRKWMNNKSDDSTAESNKRWVNDKSSYPKLSSSPANESTGGSPDPGANKWVQWAKTQ